MTVSLMVLPRGAGFAVVVCAGLRDDVAAGRLLAGLALGVRFAVVLAALRRAAGRAAEAAGVLALGAEAAGVLAADAGVDAALVVLGVLWVRFSGVLMCWLRSRRS